MPTLHCSDTTRGPYDDAPQLFAELADLDTGNPAHAKVREQLITLHLPVARHIAARFRDRGQPTADLGQVAAIGLINAVDRFDPEHGSEFLSFAVPTIMGEVRRYFRDHGWSLRVPRRLQELHLAINRAVTELSQHTGRSPTPRQLARHLGVPLEAVYEGLQVAGAYECDSLDQTTTEPDSDSLGDLLGKDDPDLAAAEDHQIVEPLLRALPPRERRIVIMRFYQDMTQTQIARKIGISQMQVSRLLTKSLATLRNQLNDSESDDE